MLQIHGLLGMYFDAVVVEVETYLLLFRLALAILWNALARVHAPADHVFHPLILRLLVLCAPADFEAQSSHL